MSNHSELWQEKLKDVDFVQARNEIACMLKILKKDAESEGTEFYAKQDWIDSLAPFMSEPCLKNAIKLLEFDSKLYPYFEQSKKSKKSMYDIKKNFTEGKDSAKLTTHKQALFGGLAMGVVISVSIFNPFPVYIKIIIFVVLSLILGAIASSPRFRGKI